MHCVLQKVQIAIEVTLTVSVRMPQFGGVLLQSFLESSVFAKASSSSLALSGSYGSRIPAKGIVGETCDANRAVGIR